MIPGALLALALAAPAAARNVDNNDVSSFAGQSGLVRVDYANDTFTGTDRYYTEGFGADLFLPSLERSPLTRALISLPGGQDSYGLSLRQSLFTPSRIGATASIPGDRPWAAYLFLGSLLVSKDPAAGLTLTAELDAGVLGPSAGGVEQLWVHERLGLNDQPRGWDTQLRDDPVLDYYARIEKTVETSPWGDFGVYADATAGTLYDNAAAGAQARLGRVAPGRGARWYFFGRGEEKIVAYDATLQGGVFNRGGAYTLAASSVERFVSRWDVGAALEVGDWALEFERTAIGREFETGIPQQWAELSVMKRF